MKRLIMFLLVMAYVVSAWAQIGYQVSLLNRATGEPRANETVSVTVVISDSRDKEIYNETTTVTTNDFGVLSLSVGNATTFADVDWNYMPLYILATVDDVLVGRSQILSVPVAEHAKHYGVLTSEILQSKTWEFRTDYTSSSLSFGESTMTQTYTEYGSGTMTITYSGSFYIDGNTILAILNGRGYVFNYVPETNWINWGEDYQFVYQ